MFPLGNTRDQERKDGNKDTEPEYLVLEAPSEGPSEGAAGATGPIYQVLEKEDQEMPPREDTIPDEPVYNVLEAE